MQVLFCLKIKDTKYYLHRWEYCRTIENRQKTDIKHQLDQFDDEEERKNGLI